MPERHSIITFSELLKTGGQPLTEMPSGIVVPGNVWEHMSEGRVAVATLAVNGYDSVVTEPLHLGNGAILVETSLPHVLARQWIPPSEANHVPKPPIPDHAVDTVRGRKNRAGYLFIGFAGSAEATLVIPGPKDAITLYHGPKEGILSRHGLR